MPSNLSGPKLLDLPSPHTHTESDRMLEKVKAGLLDLTMCFPSLSEPHALKAIHLDHCYALEPSRRAGNACGCDLGGATEGDVIREQQLRGSMGFQKIYATELLTYM